ncbi:MAG: insulinase family protein, partial [SAR324 cluster bacterium]|nr:insulinase family protein [SAR324 cluster bacterium]
MLGLLLPLLLWTSLAQAGAFDNTDPRYPERQYRRFLLPNGLKVMLVSDPTLHHGSASLVVGVGSMADPPERQGLTHFLEHMLFLGTKKYPDAGSYQEFIATHDGFSNAYTAETLTNYFFEVSGDHLEEALDRFSQFFVAPLFNSALVERELKAVGAEHSKNILNDHRRIAQVRREVYAPAHP